MISNQDLVFVIILMEKCIMGIGVMGYSMEKVLFDIFF